MRWFHVVATEHSKREYPGFSVREKADPDAGTRSWSLISPTTVVILVVGACLTAMGFGWREILNQLVQLAGHK